VNRDDVDHWLEALAARHRSSLTSAEFLKALRALSARYVERRGALPARSPLDTAGKRAAFAAFYAPLHFLTVGEITRALAADRIGLEAMVDLGCGTGVASAAWALALDRRPRIRGVDTNAWALGEAAWNWRHFGVEGRPRRENLVDAAEAMLDRRSTGLDRTAVIAAWSVNELPRHAQDRLLPVLLELSKRGARVLLVEPLARTATPWWAVWRDAVLAAGGRADLWKFETALPASLAGVDEAAGFQREGLGGKTLFM
jgi:predicted O-methyltransferase YrrM